jgi:hypothetical protein
MTICNRQQDRYQSHENPVFNTDHFISGYPSPVDAGNRTWEENFQLLFERGVDAFESGVGNPDQMFSEEEKSFLESIGATPQEIFDYVEDWAKDGEPTPETICEVTGLRREFFLTVQKGKLGSATTKAVRLPSPSASLGGHRWLPRIIGKARAKLRGELPSDIMYGCGMDRPFLQKRNIGLPEFLKVVWEAGENDKKILHYVDQKANENVPAYNKKALPPS